MKHLIVTAVCTAALTATWACSDGEVRSATEIQGAAIAYNMGYDEVLSRLGKEHQVARVDAPRVMRAAFEIGRQGYLLTFTYQPPPEPPRLWIIETYAVPPATDPKRSPETLAGIRAARRGLDDEAVKHLEAAAYQNDAEAETELGMLFARRRDAAAARRWTQRAATKGYAHAQANLGVIYENGSGVKKNPKEAAVWYRRAADQNHADGQYLLGRLLWLGNGVPADREQATRLLRQARANGAQRAGYYLICIAPETREAMARVANRQPAKLLTGWLAGSADLLPLLKVDVSPFRVNTVRGAVESFKPNTFTCVADLDLTVKSQFDLKVTDVPFSDDTDAMKQQQFLLEGKDRDYTVRWDRANTIGYADVHLPPVTP